MEDEKITTWYFGGERPTPLLVYTAVAERFGLQNGSKIQDSVIYEQVIEANTVQSREACSLEARANGEVCGNCGS